MLADALLGRDRGDVVAEHRRHPPGLGDVAVEAVGLVLRQHDDLEVAGVHDVGEREVDQPVDAGERHRRLGPVGGQRHQPLALTSGQDDGQHLLASAGAVMLTSGFHPAVGPVEGPSERGRFGACESTC